MKLKQTYPSYSKDQINSLLNLYFSKKNYGCEYSYKVEKQLEKIFNISDNIFDLYWCGVYCINKNDFNNANLYFQKAQSLGLMHWSMYHYLLCSMYMPGLDANFEELFHNVRYFSPQKNNNVESMKRFLYRVRNKAIRVIKGLS